MAGKKKTTGKKAPVKAKKVTAKAKKTSTPTKRAAKAPKKASAQPKKTPAKAKKVSAPAKKVSTKEPKKTPTQTKKAYSVSEFSEMTYLTPHGVNEWVKQGKLQGEKDNKDNWLVDAANLQLPFMKKLIR